MITTATALVSIAFVVLGVSASSDQDQAYECNETFAESLGYIELSIQVNDDDTALEMVDNLIELIRNHECRFE